MKPQYHLTVLSLHSHMMIGAGGKYKNSVQKEAMHTGSACDIRSNV